MWKTVSFRWIQLVWIENKGFKNVFRSSFAQLPFTNIQSFLYRHLGGRAEKNFLELILILFCSLERRFHSDTWQQHCTSEDKIRYLGRRLISLWYLSAGRSNFCINLLSSHFRQSSSESQRFSRLNFGKKKTIIPL